MLIIANYTYMIDRNSAFSVTEYSFTAKILDSGKLMS